MAKVVYNEFIKEVHGAVAKGGIVNRRKTYRDENGRAIHEAAPESYKILHPRDWKKNPPQGEELKKLERFREACRLTAEILRAGSPDCNPEPEQIAALNNYKQRFKAQLGKKADPEAPLNPKTGKRKQYYRLDNFIRALILVQLKSAQ
ncbi:MAG: hypothetical protein IJ776_01500 [Paludibacteraceae bacterium]|nr:hypothetical protein [Paludibacteraceae bacterium]